MKWFIAFAFVAVASAAPQAYKVQVVNTPVLEQSAPVDALRVVNAPIMEQFAPVDAVRVVDEPIMEQFAPVDAVRVVDAPIMEQSAPIDAVRVVDAPIMEQSAPIDAVRVVDAPIMEQFAPVDAVRVVDMPIPASPSFDKVRIINIPPSGFKAVDPSMLRGPGQSVLWAGELESVRVADAPAMEPVDFVRVVDAPAMDNVDFSQDEIRVVDFPGRFDDPFLRLRY